ncbi:MAG: PAS domain-containing protein [Methanomicrobiales archaeon]
MLKEKEREMSRFIDILREYPRGLTIEEISKLLPLNRNATSKYLNRMLISGQVEMKTFGPAKVFFSSKRVPITQLLNLSSDLIMVLDHDMFVRQVNDRLLDVFLVQRSDLIVHHLDHTLVGAAISPVFRQMINEGENGNERVHEEKITINGYKWHFYAKCVPVVFEAGERGVSVILRDVTVSKVLS